MGLTAESTVAEIIPEDTDSKLSKSILTNLLKVDTMIEEDKEEWLQEHVGGHRIIWIELEAGGTKGRVITEKKVDGKHAGFKLDDGLIKPAKFEETWKEAEVVDEE